MLEKRRTKSMTRRAEKEIEKTEEEQSMENLTEIVDQYAGITRLIEDE